VKQNASNIFYGPERASKDVCACFYHSILVFYLMNNKDRMTKTCINIFRSAFWIWAYGYKYKNV